MKVHQLYIGLLVVVVLGLLHFCSSTVNFIALRAKRSYIVLLTRSLSLYKIHSTTIGYCTVHNAICSWNGMRRGCPPPQPTTGPGGAS